MSAYRTSATEAVRQQLAALEAERRKIAARRLEPEKSLRDMTLGELQEILARGRKEQATSGWAQEIIDSARVPEAPALERVVVAVFPGMPGHMCGIVVAGRAPDGHCYVLGDYSMAVGGVADSMERVVAAYRDHKADVIAGVVNRAGDYLEKLLHCIDSDAQFKATVITRGMGARSAPVIALYKQGRVHHVGVIAGLEKRMGAWTAFTRGTESQVSALVCAITELGVRGD